VAVLQDDIGQVEGLEDNAVGREVEEDHDRQQRDHHPVLAQVLLPEAGAPLRRGHGVGRVAHSSLSLRRMMARMMFSCVASSPATSPTKSPSCITMILSQMPISSGISDDITMTALPASASSLMIE